MTDENGRNVGTNEPSEDPDVADIGYYGAVVERTPKPGRRLTVKRILDHGHVVGLFPTVWQRRFLCMPGETLNSLPENSLIR